MSCNFNIKIRLALCVSSCAISGAVLRTAGAEQAEAGSL